MTSSRLWCPSPEFVRLLPLGRTVRALRLARLLNSFNRGLRALGSSIQLRGFSYVVALTGIVLLLGAAGKLWWTSILLTTMEPEFWPRSPEGRLICLGLSAFMPSP